MNDENGVFDSGQQPVQTNDGESVNLQKAENGQQPVNLQKTESSQQPVETQTYYGGQR